MAGRVLGTTDYVSPEQALGRPVTGQSDLYSLGVVLYEMLTGEVPFRGETPVAVAMKHVREEIPDVQLTPAGGLGGDRRGGRPRGRPRIWDAATRTPETMVATWRRRSRWRPRARGRPRARSRTVLRSLPGGARRRLPWRMRHPARWVGLAGARGGRGRGRARPRRRRRAPRHGPAAKRPPHAGLQQVPLSQTAAHGYNPFGTGPENRDLIDNVVDNDPNTSWSTEQYYDHSLQKAGGEGLGLYLDAAPRVSAKALEIQTSTPGFAVPRVRGQQHRALPALRLLAAAARTWLAGAGGLQRRRARRRTDRYGPLWAAPPLLPDVGHRAAPPATRRRSPTSRCFGEAPRPADGAPRPRGARVRAGRGGRRSSA